MTLFNTVFAPHVDDEMIGVYSLLKNYKIDYVYYFLELTDERKKEALEVSKSFGFTAVFVQDLDTVFNPEKQNLVLKNSIIYTPSSYDLHKGHKLINKLTKQSFSPKRIKFYSIDMNRKPVFLDDASKKQNLLRFYPSQSNLFNDDKYSLFEDIHDKDYSTSLVYEDDYTYLELETDEDIDLYSINKEIDYSLSSPYELSVYFSRILGTSNKLTIKRNNKIYKFNL
jgi:hypothetical protein